jgi:hypothetical protein
MTVQRDRLAPAALVGGGAAALPFALLLLLGSRSVSIDAVTHFVSVLVSALAAMGASVAITFAGHRRRDGRAVLIGTGFLVMAALLALHGIATPGVLVGSNGLVAFAGGATLPVGAALLALSAVPALRRPRDTGVLVRLQVALVAAVIALGAAGMAFPEALPAVPRASSPPALALLAAGLAFFVVLANRAIRTFLLTRRNGDLAVAVGLGWLAAGLVGALTFTFQEAGWWLGHGYEVLGIAIVGSAVGLDLSRGAQSRALTGDLAAAELVSAEEAFLGARVRALTAHLAAKDAYTERHTRAVALRAVQVGERLGLGPTQLRELAIGGLLHDIGKLAVPATILRKPHPLTDEEYEVIKTHPERGGFSPAVHRLVLGHHERLDGSGYPDRRRDNELAADVRVLAVCDVFDALVSTRVYRSAWTTEQALAFLAERAGTEFDERCVTALRDVVAGEQAPVGPEDRRRLLPHPAERFLTPTAGGRVRVV